MGEIIRPTARKAMSKEARELAGEAEQVPLKLRVHPETRNAIRAEAAARGKSLRRFVLALCQDAGVKLHADDADEAMDFGRSRRSDDE